MTFLWLGVCKVAKENIVEVVWLGFCGFSEDYRSSKGSI
jgi:hypothetical protein